MDAEYVIKNCVAQTPNANRASALLLANPHSEFLEESLYPQVTRNVTKGGQGGALETLKGAGLTVCGKEEEKSILKGKGWDKEHRG